jgi:hypothetical protein
LIHLFPSCHFAITTASVYADSSRAGMKAAADVGDYPAYYFTAFRCRIINIIYPTINALPFYPQDRQPLR